MRDEPMGVFDREIEAKEFRIGEDDDDVELGERSTEVVCAVEIDRVRVPGTID